MNKENTKYLFDKYSNVFRLVGKEYETPWPIQLGSIDCGDGWFRIIDGLCGHIDSLIANMPKDEREQYVVHQIKEKFGGLRFYTSKSTPEMAQAIRGAEVSAIITCERCGCKGYTENNCGWTCTLCEGHHAARRAEKELQAKDFVFNYFARIGERFANCTPHLTNLLEIWKEEDDPDRPGQKHKVLVEKVTLDTEWLKRAYETRERWKKQEQQRNS